MNSQKTIVLIRLSSLGDVAMLVPVFNSFHYQYPEKKLVFISKEKFRPIFNNLDYINFVGIDKDSDKFSFLDLMRFYFKFKLKKNLVFLDLHDVIRTNILSILFSFSGNLIYKIDKGRAEKKALTEDKLKPLVSLKSSHQRYTDVFHSAGFNFDLIDIPVTKLTNAHQRKIGIAPFAKQSSKALSLSIWKSIIEQVQSELIDKNQIQFYVFGSGDEELNQANQYFSNIPNLEIKIDKLSFKEELNLISKLDLMISMDSGNGHLAANFGLPVMTIWGTTHACLGFAPYGQPIENSFYPDATLFPNLPISVFGKIKNQDYERAIDSINTEALMTRLRTILSF